MARNWRSSFASSAALAERMSTSSHTCSGIALTEVPPPMTLALSADGGLSWPHRRDVEVGDGYCLSNNSRDGVNREFSYPSVHQTADGALHLAFTHHRKAVQHVVVDPSWVDAG